MSVIAKWCFRHRLVVIATWMVVLVGLSVLAQAIKSDYDNSFSVPGTGSATALEVLAKAVPAQAGDSDTIVWRVSHGTVREGVVTVRMAGVVRKIATMPEVAGVASPYGPRGAAQISRDGRIAYATVQFTNQADNLVKADVTRVIDAAEAARAPGLDIQLGGSAIESAQQPSVGVSSAVGVLAAAVVLFIAFGSLLAMLLPIVTSIADYALFIVTRHRRGLQSGLAPGEAAVTAIDTSGRAVLFAGITVCIALLGIFVLGVGFLNGLAVACALAVVFTVVAGRHRRAPVAGGPAVPDG